MHHILGFLNTETKESYKIDEPVKGKEEFDPKLPSLNFIDEFDPITLEALKGRQSMLDEPFISETDGIIIDKVTGFSRRENNLNVHKQHRGPAPVPKIPGKPKLIAINEYADLYEEVGSYLGDRENDGEDGENQGEGEE
ncbi:fam-a protein [Plasmodium vinckei petteri]|uniref:Fam-a protein n=1 Tax=Plasmodium vinckei petteri TaxID=138298 RepID=A0A6V7SCY5_PLAVN|nr:fam-a protein [Plasmodium vinckei petteri]